MPHFLHTSFYTGGFRGRNQWFTFEDDREQLAALRSRITRDLGPEPDSTWDLLLALRHLIHSKLSHDGWRQAERHDANYLLDMAEQGVALRCVEHGTLLCQVYQAFGIPARVLGLQLPDPNLGFGKGHVLCEAWWDEGDQWVMMDSQMDAHWESGGRPLSALEAHNLLMEGRVSDLAWVFASTAGLGETNPLDGRTLQWARYFAHLRYPRNNALLSTPRTKQAGVAYLDRRVPPQFVFEGHAQPTIPEPDEAAIWFDCNRVNLHLEHVDLSEPDRVRVHIRLEHSMPWFDRYEMTAAGPGEVERSGADHLTWTITQGEPLLIVRPVNAMGRRGKATKLSMLYVSHETVAKAQP